LVVRVEVNREVLQWARSRAKRGFDELADKFPRLSEWEAGETRPTLKQLEQYAQATHTPVGYLLLDEPPDEPLPIPDFRTIGAGTPSRPSADLLDTIYQAQQRQAWYRDYADESGQAPLDFVGSRSVTDRVPAVAALMRERLDFDVATRGKTWSDALSRLVDRAEGLGVMVMINGVVGSNTHRRLDPAEFRGFALVDQLAPVVFINGADTKAAQIFTLAHELAHLWLGETALSDVQLDETPSNPLERWCNEVAAELLVPLPELRERFASNVDLTGELDRLAGIFKVSTLVVLRRLRDAGFVTQSDYDELYRAELERVLDLIAERGAGGNFYNTLPVRVSKRFARALIGSTLEGRTLYRDAFRMLGFRKLSTFHELADRLGVE
jgi:Zn-dependent peptidase ImmA (M78 family)